MSNQYMLRQGTQMYCFVDELRRFQYSPEDVLQWCGQLGVGGHAFALGAPQNRGAFPEATNEFERFLKSAIDRYGLIPSGYGGYIDSASNPSVDEMFEFTLLQLKSAKKLGFPLMRIWWAGSGYVDKLLPYAEKYRIKLAYEIHSPMALGRGDSTTDKCIKYVISKSSPYLGILPDGGSFCTRIPKVAVHFCESLGISQAIIQQVLRWYADKVPLDTAIAEAKKLDQPVIAAWSVGMLYGMAPAGDPNALRELMPYVMEVHGKFFEIENEQMDDIPYDDIVRVLVEGKFGGWVSTEYEGHLYSPVEVDSVGNVKQFQAMIQRMALKHANA